MHELVLTDRQISTFCKSSFTALLLASSAFYLCSNLTVFSKAYAQSAQEQKLELNIQSQSLGSALAIFADRVGVHLLMPSSLVAGKTSSTLKGSYTTDQALIHLLAGSGLQFRFHDNNSVTIFSSVNDEGGEQPAINADGGILLNTIIVSGSSLNEDYKSDVYSAPRSTVYISSEELNRFSSISAADILKGVAGVQVGDGRNGGGLDVNIRGIQGQSRVAVTVDGTQQALDVYRGYAGTQQRSYIDPDLISNVLINKGPSLDASSSGAIGGVVQMETLKIDDVLRSENNFGIRLKGELWNNGVRAPYRSSDIQTSRELYSQPRSDRPGLFHSEAKSGSLALGYRQDSFDLLAAYAVRDQGNYFAGKRGHGRYRIYNEEGRQVSSVASTYAPNEEVLNSSFRTKSVLLKSNIKPTEEQNLEFTYRYFDGNFGEIMPSDIIRYGDRGIYQYPLGSMRMNTASARYSYNSEENDWVDLRTNMWWNNAKSSQLNGVIVPNSQSFQTDRNWVRMDDTRFGGDITNTSRYSSKVGDFKLDFGSGFLYENMRPQRDVIITERDRESNKFLRDGSRAELNLSGKLEYEPIAGLQLWMGGRYSTFRSKDRNAEYIPRYGQKYGKWIMLSNGKKMGYLFWEPDENGNYTDKTDPRLNNAVVFSDTHNPFDGTPFNDFGKLTYEEVYNPGVWDGAVIGFDKNKTLTNKNSGFTPAFGVNYEIRPDTFLYVTYTEGLRMPSLFETTNGTLSVAPPISLKPERAQNWELGVSERVGDLITAGDTTSLKLAYFNNNIKNYVTRYFDPYKNGLMTFTNADSYKTSGLEFQSSYDSGRYFADFSATYYFKTQTCDKNFVAYIRSQDPSWNDTPTCTPGSYMGSYTNTQNPPKYAINLTLGTRLLDESLVLGGRMVYTSGPTEKMDKPWQSSPTTPQLVYKPVALFDAFVNYELRDDAVINASVQNISNRYYIDPLAQSFMPAPGRNYRLGLTMKF